jgi:hypothetical protein
MFKHVMSALGVALVASSVVLAAQAPANAPNDRKEPTTVQPSANANDKTVVKTQKTGKKHKKHHHKKAAAAVAPVNR